MTAGTDAGFTALGVFPHDAGRLASDLHAVRFCGCADSSLLFTLPIVVVVAASFLENKSAE